MWTFWRILIASALFWLIFVCGYLCRDVLGSWLVDAHSGPLQSQVVIVGSGVGRLFLSFVIVIGVTLFCVLVLFLAVGFSQELWYQIFTRRVIALYMKRRTQERQERRDSLEDVDPEAADIGAPKKPVSVLRHLRSEPGKPKEDSENSEEPPKTSITGRFKKLKEQADLQLAAEREQFDKAPADMSDDEFELTYDND